jgi:tetratricopeptide (TPR) repeat protein
MTDHVPPRAVQPGRSVKTWIAAFATLATGLATAAAQEPVATAGWHAVHAPEFTLISDLSASDTRTYADLVELMIKALRGRLPIDSRILPPATLLLFRSRSELMNFKPVDGKGVPFEDIESDVSGFSVTAPWGAIDAAGYDGSDEGTRPALLQGAAAWLFSTQLHPLPLALGIGIRQVFGTFYVENGMTYLGRPPHGAISFVARAAENFHSGDSAYVPIEHLLAETSLADAVARHGFQMLHAESWAFVHYLIFSKEMAGTNALSRLADSFGRGLPAEQALRDALGPAANDINSRFRTYLRGGDFYEERRPVEPTGLVVVDASPAEAAAALARLAQVERHWPSALAYAQDAVRLGPSAGSYDTLALVESEAKRDQQALAACQEAIKLGSRDGWTWNLYARSFVHLYPGHALSPEDARQVLNWDEKAVSYRHDLKLVFDFLPSLIASASRVNPDDGKFIVFGRQLFPDDGWLEVGQAQWAIRSGNPDLARRLLDNVLAHPEKLSAGQAAQARQLRGTLGADNPRS